MTGDRFYGSRSCRGCGKPSREAWCASCDESAERNNFTPRGEWSVCTRCGHVNGRHATGCRRDKP